MKGGWTPHETRDEVVDYVRTWSGKTGVTMTQLVDWLGISRSKYFNWRHRYGKVNEHNSWIPRDWWLEDWEKEAIVQFFIEHPDQGYRRLTYMMLDADVVAVSASSVYRVLRDRGLLERWNRKPSKKGTGFEQPLGAHEHWHVDIAHINICGTFYYLCGVLDGYSRYVVHWEIRECMTEMDVETILQRASEKFPHAQPRIISDNGPQFVAKDFKHFIRLAGMTHVRTRPYYPQSNGKYERWNGTVQQECVRPKAPGTIDEAQEIVSEYIKHYNTERLHSGIAYIAPLDKLEGRADAIHADRDRKLDAARQRRARDRAKLSKVAS